MVWLWFGNNVIINLTLAVVEHGYLDQKYSQRFDWVYQPIRDPEHKLEHEEIDEMSLTPPDALKNLHLRKSQLKSMRAPGGDKMSLDNFRGGIQEFLEIQEYLD